MSAARLTSGAEVTAVVQVVVTTDWPWSPADVDAGDVVDAAAGEFDDGVMTSTDDDGIRRRCGRIDSGLPDIFASEKHHATLSSTMNATAQDAVGLTENAGEENEGSKMQGWKTPEDALRKAKCGAKD